MVMCECGAPATVRNWCRPCYLRGRYHRRIQALPPLTYVPAAVVRMRAWEYDVFDMAEVAWAAGLFEGEGSFVTNGHRALLYPRAQLATVDRDVLDHFLAVMRIGKIYTFRRKTVTGKTVHRWSADGPQVEGVAVLLWPWLGQRRRGRAIEILRNWREPRAGNIGEPMRKITLEPLPEEAPIAEPSPQPEPERAPEPALEPAPA
jgi:hypothetical protein